MSALSQVASFVSGTFANSGQPKSATSPEGPPKAPTYAEMRAQKRFFDNLNETAFAGAVGGITLNNDSLSRAQEAAQNAPSSKMTAYKTGISSKNQALMLEQERNQFVAQAAALKAAGSITDEEASDILAQYAVGINQAKESAREVTQKTKAFYKDTVKASNVPPVKVRPADATAGMTELGYE